MPHDSAHHATPDPTHVERKLPPEIADDRLDPDAVKVVRRLRRAGFTAYLVGGCVRDLLLGMRPKDFDVATSAHPNEVKATFRNSRRACAVPAAIRMFACARTRCAPCARSASRRSAGGASSRTPGPR